MTEPQTYTVRPPASGDEALVTHPNGRVQFMGLWQLFRFAIQVLRAGDKIEVKDE